MILICISVNAVFLIAAVVTIVVEILVFASADCYITTIVTCVILICISVNAIFLIAAVVAIMVEILVFASADCYITSPFFFN